MRIAVGAAAVAAANQARDLDPRHHHRGAGGGGGGGGGGAAQQQEEDDHHRLLQLHQQAHHDQAVEPPSVPVFQLQQLQQAAAVRHHRASSSSSDYALLAPMGDAGQQSHHHHQQHHGGFQPQLLSFGGAGGVGTHQFAAQAAAASQSSSSRGVRSGGEIVAVQGGHIVRSTGRKDRHSKVCTARGPRDRRVRLSAHTAIQFYDVQDRLGYDRPSKAVDWLIKNAKDAIDKLEVMPAWHPTATNAAAAQPPPSSSTHHPAENSDDQAQAITVAQAGYDFPGAAGGDNTGGGGGTGFLPSSLDSDSISDTIKSFFPMGGTTGGGDSSSSAAAAQSSAAMGGGFQSYTPDLLSRTGSHSQELRLSLQSLPDPMFHHHHQNQHQQEHDDDRSTHGHGGNGSAQQTTLFPSYSFGGGGAMWAEQAQSQRMLPWNVPDPGGGGYLFNVSQQSQFLFQRGPLQSSNNQPSDRGWPDTVVEADNPMSAVGFAPGIGFSGFRIPARIQGDEEDHNAGGGNNGEKPPPSVSSSASHH